MTIATAITEGGITLATLEDGYIVKLAGVWTPRLPPQVLDKILRPAVIDLIFDDGQAYYQAAARLTHNLTNT